MVLGAALAVPVEQLLGLRSEQVSVLTLEALMLYRVRGLRREPGLLRPGPLMPGLSRVPGLSRAPGPSLELERPVSLCQVPGQLGLLRQVPEANH